MLTFVNKALAYIGLTDVEDDDDFDSDVPIHQNVGSSRTVYPEREHETPADRRFSNSPLRPITSDDRSHESIQRDPSSISGAGTGPSRASVVRPMPAARPPTAKVHVVVPTQFGDAQEIGDLVRSSSPVILNLQMSNKELSRRMIDFCSGLTYALSGSMEKVADQVFLLTPSNVEVSPEERLRLQERGLLR